MILRQQTLLLLLASLACTPGSQAIEGDFYLARDGKTVRGSGQPVVALRASPALLTELDSLCFRRRSALDTLASQSVFLPMHAAALRLEAMSARLVGRPYRRLEDSSLRVSEVATRAQKAIDSLHAATRQRVTELWAAATIGSTRADVNGHFVFEALPRDSVIIAATMTVDSDDYLGWRSVPASRERRVRLDLDSLADNWKGLACGDDDRNKMFFASEAPVRAR